MVDVLQSWPLETFLSPEVERNFVKKSLKPRLPLEMGADSISGVIMSARIVRH